MYVMNTEGNSTLADGAISCVVMRHFDSDLCRLRSCQDVLLDAVIGVLDTLRVLGAVFRRFLHSGALVQAFGVHDHKLNAARDDLDKHARLPF